MVISPPLRPPRITKFLKSYVLKMHFTNKYVNAQVIHSPTATVASFASSQEKALRPSLESTRDVGAAVIVLHILCPRIMNSSMVRCFDDWNSTVSIDVPEIIRLLQVQLLNVQSRLKASL